MKALYTKYVILVITSTFLYVNAAYAFFPQASPLFEYKSEIRKIRSLLKMAENELDQIKSNSTLQEPTSLSLLSQDNKRLFNVVAHAFRFDISNEDPTKHSRVEKLFRDDFHVQLAIIKAKLMSKDKKELIKQYELLIDTLEIAIDSYEIRLFVHTGPSHRNVRIHALFDDSLISDLKKPFAHIFVTVAHFVNNLKGVTAGIRRGLTSMELERTESYKDYMESSMISSSRLIKLAPAGTMQAGTNIENTRGVNSQ